MTSVVTLHNYSFKGACKLLASDPNYKKMKKEQIFMERVQFYAR